MKLEELIRKYREKEHLTMQEFADRCNLSKGYVSMLEKGKHPQSQRRLVPSLETLKKISVGMGLSMDELLSMLDGNTMVSLVRETPEDTLAPEESRLVRLWRRADEYDRNTVMTVLKRYEKAEDPKPPLRLIRHYLVPAAAGYASPIEGEDYEDIPLPPDAPQEADFCIEISGDSMEPYIHDGQRVYIKQGADLREFEPGVFFIDGDVYCKQFAPGYGADLLYLLSANPLREDANITIRRDSARSCVYFGKVLLDKKLPRPVYDNTQS